jgi:ribulose-phosphate 3-epimerase
MTIIPALLSDEQDVIASQLTAVQEHDVAVEIVQVDIIDGDFADNITISPLDLPNFEFNTLAVDLHLMTIEPLDFVYEARDIAQVVPLRAIIAQVEKMSSQENFIEEVKKNNWLPGLSLDAYTPITEISKDSWEDLRIVQVMGIEAGFQGQQFIEQTYERIEEIKKLIELRNPDIELYVDGGVTVENIPLLEQLGVDAVVVGSSLFKTGDVIGELEKLQEAML